MKILLLGASGDAGSRLAAEARSRGHRITAASRMENVAIAVLDEAERPTVRRGLVSIGR